MQERIKFQKTTLDSPLAIQEKITDEEWDAIMKIVSKKNTKVQSGSIWVLVTDSLIDDALK